MDAAQLGALGTIIVGLAAATGALIGQRGATRATRDGAVLTGYGNLVDQVQEERDKAQAQLAQKELKLAEAYAELARERADKAALQNEINMLNTEITRLRDRIAELGGQPT
ncbi:hypothetical protein [Streptomyces sp. SCSIO ZS0520]|uniref:hypothetical protein n=1 Tax=Streptomyces sp. SCSIO ZS0520 TaxID=2892996 RepID=UPI0021D9ADDE|nr:hypothetical protein [Streptomyces sp. SCSIO ZS0520]